MTKQIKVLSTEELVNQVDSVSELIVDATFKLIDGYYKNNPKLNRALLMSFVSKFIRVAVYRSITVKFPEGVKTPQQQYDFTAKNFAVMKCDLQNAVSDAFTAAMSAFQGKKMKDEYYCQVKIMPPVANKEPI